MAFELVNKVLSPEEIKSLLPVPSHLAKLKHNVMWKLNQFLQVKINVLS